LITMPATDDPDVAAAIKEHKGPVIEGWWCKDCGADYGNVKPERCIKCNSYAIENLVNFKNIKINSRMMICGKKTRQSEEVKTSV
jgi:ABC-type ATPase with predicted acetyltransferase domain